MCFADLSKRLIITNPTTVNNGMSTPRSVLKRSFPELNGGIRQIGNLRLARAVDRRLFTNAQVTSPGSGAGFALHSAEPRRYHHVSMGRSLHFHRFDLAC